MCARAVANALEVRKLVGLVSGRGGLCFGVVTDFRVHSCLSVLVDMEWKRREVVCVCHFYLFVCYSCVLLCDCR